MRTKKRVLTCLAAVSVFAIVVCAAPHGPQASVSTANVRADEHPNEALTRVIQHQLLVLPYYSVFDIVSFSLYGSQVTLTGQVVRPSLKAHAEAAIKSIEGVSAVVNNIEVLPVSPSDDELRRDVYRALFEDKMLERYATLAVPPIHIIVKDSSVTLVGWVENDADKAEAATRARSVDGVLKFANQLQVRPKPAEPPAQ